MTHRDSPGDLEVRVKDRLDSAPKSRELLTKLLSAEGRTIKWSEMRAFLGLSEKEFGRVYMILAGLGLVGINAPDKETGGEAMLVLTSIGEQLAKSIQAAQ